MKAEDLKVGDVVLYGTRTTEQKVVGINPPLAYLEADGGNSEPVYIDDLRKVYQRTIADLAREALDVQDACNLSGVVQRFARVMKDLRRLYPGLDTHMLNTHYICVLWSDKIAHLTNSGDTETLGLALLRADRDSKSKSGDSNDKPSAVAPT